MGHVVGALATDQELEPDLLPLRSVLGPIEHARMAWLAQKAQLALDVALEGVTPGRTEHAVAAAMEAELGAQGIRVPVALVAADERIAAYRHPLPTDHAIRRRVMLIVVAERWGLNVAGTQFRDSEPPDADILKRMDECQSILHTMEKATRPGANLGDVFAAAQRAYAAFGRPDEWRLHHQGGSIGYRTREAIAVPGDPTPIVAGMAFAWNPSITGAKAESTILVSLAGGPPLRLLG